jgi:hypothetical protein
MVKFEIVRYTQVILTKEQAGSQVSLLYQLIAMGLTLLVFESIALFRFSLTGGENGLGCENIRNQSLSCFESSSSVGCSGELPRGSSKYLPGMASEKK